jgi:energy-coupling factor transporter ATP-binding protein EcfA2
MNLSLAPGSRCLLIGANGAGKTTLLKILGGKHMVPQASGYCVVFLFSGCRLLPLRSARPPPWPGSCPPLPPQPLLLGRATLTLRRPGP